MPKVDIRSYVKINLSIDVGPCRADGYHTVDMVMQQLAFHDDVEVEYTPVSPDAESGSFDIEVRTNRYYLPVDRRNLAYRAAELMISAAGDKAVPGKICIDIKKRIPVAGGLAGGSGNGAAVIHALNILWDLHLSLRELMDIGAGLGSDVPFCVMGQARTDKAVPEYLKKDPMASSCARAVGRGTELTPVRPLKSWMVIAKPRFSVSTKEVYSGIDEMEITARPDNDRLVQALSEGRKDYEDFVNVLEEYTLKKYPEVADLKEYMTEAGAEFSLMSGSGPTVFGIFGTVEAAKEAAEKIQGRGLEAYWTRTDL